MGVFGNFIPDEVRTQIEASEAVVCDVTVPNQNVYYEFGYGIGRGKTVLPVVNSSHANAAAALQRDGIFDNIGFKTYENSSQLASILTSLEGTTLSELYGKPINNEQPIYFLNAFRKTDFLNEIASSIKESKVFFRSFDPAEVPRFSSVYVIAEASASSGIIIPLLAPHIDDAERHNLRASFLAGLANGLGRQTLLLRLKSQDVGPADFRDTISDVASPADIKERVVEFARSAAIYAPQLASKSSKRERKSELQRLSLGASAAENEFRTLENYFVETSEFLRTQRQEISVVAGRKGSGKTAIFFMARDSFRQKKPSIVADLKPESHQLSLFREELLKTVGSGVFDHTLAAFWYFVFLSEILLSIKREYDFNSRFNAAAVIGSDEVNAVLGGLEIQGSGDFTARINRLTEYIVSEIKAKKAKKEILSPEALTGIIFRNGIARLKSQIIKHSTPATSIVLLFDNIDKGWPTDGVDEFDIRLVRLLIEALDKIKSDFRVLDREFHSVVFLRNDIYELLVEGTPDRGKSAQVRIDWTDRAKLRQVIFNRLRSSSQGRSKSFDELWSTFFTKEVRGKPSFEYFLDHCLMRPRFLINLIEYAIANAINRGHIHVDEQDCVDAVKQHSLYLIDDFGYEIRDVSGLSADILYSLVGIDKTLSKDEVIRRFQEFGIKDSQLENAFRLMLWYGILGVVTNNNKEKFIYDFEYNLKRLQAEIRNSQQSSYVTNAAIHVALGSEQ